MALDLSKFSTTPTSNDIASYFQTGMKPSSVKTAGWNIAAIVAQLFNSKTTSVGTNTITLTNPVPLTSLTTGLLCIFTPANANTGAVTFAPDGLTAHAINAYGAALQGGELSTSVPAWVQYDLANTVWNLINPQRNTNADYAAASGTNTITATVTGVTAYYEALRVKLKIANTTTAAATLNLNSVGAKNLYYSDGTTQIVAGALIQNNTYTFTYDSSLNAAAGGFIVSEPSRVSGSFTLTLATGLTTTPTGTVNYEVDTTGKGIDILYQSGNITATSNASGMTGTGVPAIIQTATSKRVLHGTSDSGGETIGGIVTGAASGTWTFLKNFGTTNFATTGGGKGIIGATTAHYTTD